MNTVKKLGLAALAGGLIAAGGVAAPANAEPAGQYDYTCISSQTGVSYSWNGNAPETCNGWLDARINGELVAHVNMGDAYIQNQFALNQSGEAVSVGCAAAIGSVVLSAAGVGTPIGWVALGYSLATIGLSCP